MQIIGIYQTTLCNLIAGSKQKQLAEMLAKNIRFDEISEPTGLHVISKKAIEGVDSEQLEDLYTNNWQTRNTIRQKIESLLFAHQEEKFKEWLDTGQIKMSGSVSSA